MTKIVIAAFFTTACLALGSAAYAEVSKKDQEFFNKAAGGGMFEVEAGKLAQSKGQSDGVKSFGEMLVKDHGMANDELKALAAKKGAALPSAVPADMQKQLDKLAKAKDFDKDFIKDVGLSDHKKDIALFEKTSKGADDADVKAFAIKTLPTLKAHLSHAESLKTSAKH
jgi:putative membrane protein